MKYYISGGITGIENYMETFKKAEEHLIAQGHSVINPAKVNANLPTDTTYEQYMKMCYCMLDMCEGIYMLKDWENSRGANREMGYAIAKGLVITEQTDQDLQG